jgi:hypothetical protein
MRKQTGLLAAGALTALALSIMLALPAPAKAEVRYPWCAQLAGEDGDGGTNCGFTTLAQCRATISGIGGYCYENPAYPTPRQRPRMTGKPRY